MLKTSMQLLLAIKSNISIDKILIFNHSTCSGFFFRSCKILFGLVKFMTAPDRMSGNVWKVFVITAYCNLFATRTGFYIFWFPTFLWLSRTCDIMEFFSIVANQVSRLF